MNEGGEGGKWEGGREGGLEEGGRRRSGVQKQAPSSCVAGEHFSFNVSRRVRHVWRGSHHLNYHVAIEFEVTGQTKGVQLKGTITMNMVQQFTS